jgi:hypothetical protein
MPTNWMKIGQCAARVIASGEPFLMAPNLDFDKYEVTFKLKPA